MVAIANTVLSVALFALSGSLKWHILSCSVLNLSNIPPVHPN